jgi:hypothetical protein
VDEEIITVPDYIPKTYQEVGFNAPWIVRPTGPMFWEQVQFRDASPDHLHATFPGHRFDGLAGERASSDPIRRQSVTAAGPKAGASTWRRPRSSSACSTIARAPAS